MSDYVGLGVNWVCRSTEKVEGGQGAIRRRRHRFDACLNCVGMRFAWT